MDNDTKHVLTIFGLVVCFGVGYFTCKIENTDALKIGEKFSAFTRVENAIDGKENISFENEGKAIESAVNAYYSESSDKWIRYNNKDDEEENVSTEEYEYTNTYKMIGDICYINSNHFSLDGVQGFIKAFKECPDAEGFIVDLRNNMGGYTDYSMSALGNFIGSCNIGKYHYHDGSEETISTGTAEKKTDKKVVILVNEKTASSSEIFVSAMKQFYNDAVIVGTRTFGKGVFQITTRTEKAEDVRYTAGYYTIGNWQCYDGIGIDPDIEIEMEYDPDIICTDEDIQLNKAIELFN